MQTELNRARQIIGWAARIDTLEQLDIYLHSSPIVFRKQIAIDLRGQLQEALGDRNRRRRFWTEGLSEDDPELSWTYLTTTVEAVLDRIDDLRNQYEEHSIPFPLGNGPIEKLWRGIDDGVIDTNGAQEFARKPEVSSNLAPCYVYALSNHAVNLAHANCEAQALKYQQVLLASLDETESAQDHIENMNVAESDWVEIVMAYLALVPDARLLREAIKRGTNTVERTSLADPHVWHSLTIHRLGLLHLEPYVRGRRSQNFEMDDKLWRSKFLTSSQLDAASLPESEWQMPPIGEALVTAEQYLRTAREKRAGEVRALSTKALVDVLRWKRGLELPVDSSEVVSLCDEALALGLSKYPSHVLSLNRVKATFEKLPQKLNPEFTLQRVLEMRSSLNPTYFCELLLQVGNGFGSQWSSGEICEYVEAVSSLREFFEEHAHEAHKSNRRKLLGEMLWRLFVITPENHSNDFQNVLRHARSGHSKQEMAGYGLHLTNLASSLDEELTAHELFEEVTTSYPDFSAKYSDSLSLLKARLLLNIGADYANTGRLEQAALAYLDAFQNFLVADELSSAREILRRFLEVLSASKYDLTHVGIKLLRTAGVQYELKGGARAACELKEIADLCSARIYEFGGNGIEKLAELIQVAKGRLLANAGLANRPLDSLIDDSLTSLFESSLKAHEDGILDHNQDDVEIDGVPKQEAEPRNGEVDASLYQLSCPDPEELHAGSNTKAIQSNIEHRFNSLVWKTLWRQGSTNPMPVMEMSAVWNIVGSETALLDIYLGADLNSRLAVYVAIYVSQSFGTSRVGHSYYPSGFYVGTYEGQHVRFNAMAGVVSTAKQSILSEPGMAAVCPFAQRELERWIGGFWANGVAEKLKELGKTHLCIIPHGPLHFFPFHLLGPANKPLGTQWRISYSPHLSFLSSTVKRRTPKRTMVAFGKSFSETTRPGLSSIPEAVEEADEIAKLFGCEAIVEQNFTPQTISSHIVDSRFVHISTHGEQNAVAPALHRLFMSIDSNGSDSLCAFEILKLDLRAVRVVSLSACDTGLGRIDTGDNLGGLATSFMLAGAQSVLATLWPVTPETSKFFFLRFYSELQHEKPILDAFFIAQQATRDRFLAYRDWGAFCLLGDWRQA